MEHAQWVDALIAPDNRRTASKKAGLSESTLSRQLQRGALPPESAIALCRIYDHPPVDGLVELGYLDSHEVTPGMRVSVSTMTNDQISDILAAISEEIINRSLDDDSIHDHGQDDLAARRQNPPVSTPSAHDGTVTDWDDSQPFAADSSPDEGGTPDDYIP